MPPMRGFWWSWRRALRFTLIESHTGTGAHQTNSYVELLAADNTDVTAIKLQTEISAPQHLATFAIKLGADAKLTTVARRARRGGGAAADVPAVRRR